MVQNANISGFAEKTPILMADGTWKNIELIKQGDMVLSFDPSIPDSELEPRKVTNTFYSVERDCVEVLAENRITVAAKDQLFFTPKAQFKPSFETTDVMFYDGSAVQMQTRKTKGGKWKIYDVEVEGTHSLVANGLRAHNKKKTSTVVVSGRVGVPLTVSKVVTKKSGKIVSANTVTVYPPPEQAAQIISNNNSISIKNQSIPGVPLPAVIVEPTMFLPYPSASYISDRVNNAENIRMDVCNDMLDRTLVAKKKNVVTKERITPAERVLWTAQLSSLQNELLNMRTVGVPSGNWRISMASDPTLVQAALNEVAALKQSIAKAKKVDYFFTEQRCANLQSLINRIGASAKFPSGPVCGPVWNPATGSYAVVPCQPNPEPPVVICPPVTQPSPGNYVDAKIYQNTADYSYFTWVDTTCRYEFNPPSAAVAAQTYYKHYDSGRGLYYYDRIKDGQICPAGAGTASAA